MILKIKFEDENDVEVMYKFGEGCVNKSGDAGFDLYCPDDITFKPFETKKIDLKVKCVMIESDVSVSYFLFARSSIYKTPLRLSNCVGIIDSGYRGNICIVLDNIKNEEFKLQKGTRLVQVCHPSLKVFHPVKVDFLDLNTERSTGGFGSTN